MKEEEKKCRKPIVKESVSSTCLLAYFTSISIHFLRCHQMISFYPSLVVPSFLACLRIFRVCFIVMHLRQFDLLSLHLVAFVLSFCRSHWMNNKRQWYYYMNTEQWTHLNALNIILCALRNLYFYVIEKNTFHHKTNMYKMVLHRWNFCCWSTV